MENEKKPKKRSLRLLSVFTVVLLLAFMAVPAFAAGNYAIDVNSIPIIKAGTYRFNDVLTMAEEVFAELHSASNGLDIFEIQGEIDGEYFVLNYYSHNGNSTEQNVVYLSTGMGVYADGWQDEAYKTITIPTDQEVSAEFAEWFTANAVEQKTIKAGTYRFNDVLTESDIELNADIDFTVAVTAHGTYEGTAYCDNITFEATLYNAGTPTAFWYNVMRFNVSELDPSSAYLPTPIQLLIYQTTHLGGGETSGIWETYSYSEGIKTITILNDTEVSDEFYAWFTVNAVPANSFRDSVTSGLTVVIEWVGTVVSSLFSGELSGLLPIVAIPVAVTLLFLAIYFIRRSIWGA